MDLRGLPAGDYWLEAANPSRNSFEAGYANNVSRALVHID